MTEELRQIDTSRDSSPVRSDEEPKSYLYSQQPDYELPSLEFSKDAADTLLDKLRFLYGEQIAQSYLPELQRILKVHYAHKPAEMRDNDRRFKPEERFTEKDVILITYGDLIRGRESSPLANLAKFCRAFLAGTVNTLHILPFFPYSSDRGFAVIDFKTVDPNLGSWQDIEQLSKSYKLMFDGVVNHVSSKSRWFQEFLSGNPRYKDFFTAYESETELTAEQRRAIFRPRTSDILSRFKAIDNPVHVWTTFSEDQIDLNYKNPEVLLRVLETLLFYIRNGSSIIRLDAVTYLWSEPGTRCASLEETHEVIKLMRSALDIVAPEASIITETNVPHEENISYFGNGGDEAQMVYNFALPPLVLYTFYSENTAALSGWAKELQYPPNASYFNFLDSHDGIGLMGVRGILDDDQIDFVIENAKEHGGYVSYKTGDDGKDMPYEVNITWFSALNHEEGDEDIAFQVKRFVASRIISLVLKGVPGIYLHSLLGTHNDIESVLTNKTNRDINRSVIDCEAVNNAIMNPFSKFSRINRELGRLITIRTEKKAFHPYGGQKVLDIAPEIFGVLRTSPDGDDKILALVNVSNRVCSFQVQLSDLESNDTDWYDIVSAVEWMSDEDALHITMDPYDTIWLEPLISGYSVLIRED